MRNGDVSWRPGGAGSRRKSCGGYGSRRRKRRSGGVNGLSVGKPCKGAVGEAAAMRSGMRKSPSGSSVAGRVGDGGPSPPLTRSRRLSWRERCAPPGGGHGSPWGWWGNMGN